MEGYVLLGGLAGAAAFGCAAALAQSACVRVRRGRRAQPLGGGARHDGVLARRVRNGVVWMKPAACVLLRNRRVQELAEAGVRELSERGLPSTQEGLLSLFAAAIAAVTAVVGTVSASAVCGLAVAACLCALTGAWLHAKEDRRREATRDAVPDALRSMGVCFQSGLSLLQTFQQVASEAHGPLQRLFQHAAHRLETGQSAEAALEALRLGSSVPELAFVAVALDVQHQAGGSLRQVLDAARDTVEGEIELRRSLKVQTAQAKLSARVVSVMPFVLVAVFSLVSEGFLEPFFSSALGLALLALALGMQAAGILAVRRMLAVEVG